MSQSSNDSAAAAAADPTEFVKPESNHKESLSDTLRYAKKVLITKEDPFHTHKILASLCLCSFIFRFYNVGESDMGFANPKYQSLTVPTMLLHFSLNLSSFLFNIPKKRIKHGGRMWPEFRLHNLIFNLRSQLIMAWYLYEKHYDLPPNYTVNYLILMLNFALVDLSSKYLIEPQYRSNPVRGLTVVPPAIRFCFSILQFNGTANLLFGLRRFSIPMLPIFAIQMTAFLGTLQRKNLIKYTALVLYVLLFSNAFFVQYIEYSSQAPPQAQYVLRIVMFGCALLRLSNLPKFLYPIQSKYGVWTVGYIGLTCVRPHLETIPIRNLQIILGAILALLPVSYYFKKDYYTDPKSITKKTI